VDAVITELTAGILDGASAAPTASIPTKAPPAAAQASSSSAQPVQEEEVVDEDEIQQMRARLAEL